MREILIAPSNFFLFTEIKNLGYTVITPYRGYSLILRTLRLIWFKYKLPFKRIWYNKEAICNSDTIVVYEPRIIPDFLYWLYANNKGSRIILQYCNPVQSTINPLLIPDEWCEKWTTDPDDSKIYGLKYKNFGGYPSNISINHSVILYDIFYIGKDKKRSSKLFEIERLFKSYGLSTFFYIVAEKQYKRFNKSYYRPEIPYSKVVDYIGQSRAILHLVDGCEKGVTIRILESLFLKVKLISDYIDLIEYDFYHTDNIFILGIDDISTLPAFILKPYHDIEQDIINKYSFKLVT